MNKVNKFNAKLKMDEISIQIVKFEKKFKRKPTHLLLGPKLYCLYQSYLSEMKESKIPVMESVFRGIPVVAKTGEGFDFGVDRQLVDAYLKELKKEEKEAYNNSIYLT